MRVDGAICMYAEDAHVITELARKPINPWDKLFNRIKEEAEKVTFKEHRKEVKSKLEELGYSVTYSRQRDSDDWCGITYHNRYVIEW